MVGWQLRGKGGRVLAGVGLVVAPRMSPARALPGPRQGSFRGVVGVPGKRVLPGGLVGILSKISPRISVF